MEQIFVGNKISIPVYGGFLYHAFSSGKEYDAPMAQKNTRGS